MAAAAAGRGTRCRDDAKHSFWGALLGFGVPQTPAPCPGGGFAGPLAMNERRAHTFQCLELTIEQGLGTQELKRLKLRKGGINEGQERAHPADGGA